MHPVDFFPPKMKQKTTEFILQLKNSKDDLAKGCASFVEKTLEAALTMEHVKTIDIPEGAPAPSLTGTWSIVLFIFQAQ